MFPIEISSSLGGEAGTLAWKNSKSFYKLRAAAGLARHDGLMHAAKSMKNGSEWDGPFDLFNRYISRENMKEYDGPNRCYCSSSWSSRHRAVQKHLLFAILLKQAASKVNGKSWDFRQTHWSLWHRSNGSWQPPERTKQWCWKTTKER